jgi:hypothetical protein
MMGSSSTSELCASLARAAEAASDVEALDFSSSWRLLTDAKRLVSIALALVCKTKTENNNESQVQTKHQNKVSK